MFISFEGIEGSGKSTQIELIEELIRAKGYQVKKLREQGVDIIIAIGHSGYQRDLEIAEKVYTPIFGTYITIHLSSAATGRLMAWTW